MKAQHSLHTSIQAGLAGQKKRVDALANAANSIIQRFHHAGANLRQSSSVNRASGKVLFFGENNGVEWVYATNDELWDQEHEEHLSINDGEQYYFAKFRSLKTPDGKDRITGGFDKDFQTNKEAQSYQQGFTHMLERVLL